MRRGVRMSLLPVYDVSRMKIVESLDHASCVKSSGCIIKVPPITQNRPQFTAETALHQHVQVFAIFERLEQLYDEITVCLGHNFLFGHDVLLLSGLDDLRLLHLLQRERSRRVSLDLDQFDSSKAANA